jgi:hypothetical protein
LSDFDYISLDFLLWALHLGSPRNFPHQEAWKRPAFLLTRGRRPAPDDKDSFVPGEKTIVQMWSSPEKAREERDIDRCGSLGVGGKTPLMPVETASKAGGAREGVA